MDRLVLPECPICFHTNNKLESNEICQHQICEKCYESILICPFCRKTWPSSLKKILVKYPLPSHIDSTFRLHLSQMCNLSELIELCNVYTKEHKREHKGVYSLRLFIATLDISKYELNYIMNKKCELSYKKIGKKKILIL